MLVATGEIGRTPIVACAQDFTFMAGSMGMYVEMRSSLPLKKR